MMGIAAQMIVENYFDVLDVKHGRRDTVRKLTADEVRIDQEISTIAISREGIASLGLAQSTRRNSRKYFGPVKLKLQGRECHFDVIESRGDFPIVIGVCPLTMLDLVIDASAQRLIGNPAHGGEQMLECY